MWKKARERPFTRFTWRKEISNFTTIAQHTSTKNASLSPNSAAVNCPLYFTTELGIIKRKNQITSKSTSNAPCRAGFRKTPSLLFACVAIIHTTPTSKTSTRTPYTGTSWK
jgi:hypothetical protein